MTFQNRILNQGQSTALADIQEFLADDSRRLFILDGPAGTGKTTLLDSIRATTKTIVCAPTNKATGVLRAKGFPKATTLDRVINKTIWSPTSRPPTEEEIAFFTANEMDIPQIIVEEGYEKVDAEGENALVCCDEASMTNEHEFARLMDAYPKVIAIGDGFQLPPVEGDMWFQTATPDARLTEIMRTGEGSEIAKLAELIRRQTPEWKKHAWRSEVTIIRRNDAGVNEAMRTADITLAWTNKTCDATNLRIRDLRDLIAPNHDYEQPGPGDVLLAWDNFKTKTYAICKSELYPVVKAYPTKGGYLVMLRGLTEFIPISRANLQQQKTEIVVAYMKRFSFGHCITAHKAQGSEWDRVVVMAYDHPPSMPGYWNWLYTACTRAKKHLTVVI